MIKRIVTKISNKKKLRYFYKKLVKSLTFKLAVIGSIILIIFSITVFYLEKNHIVYTMVDGKRVEDSSSSSNIRTLKDSVWWAFVTSTTVGYGDYFPKSTPGRIVGILLMFFGISLVGVITGNIASLLVEKQLREDRGLKQITLKNHFIICGWKRDMAQFMHDVLYKNKSYLSSEIVIISTAEQEEIDSVRADDTLSNINFIHGDDIDERVLHRANIKQAKKALILADRLVKGSVQEIDARTVMTIITIKSISKSVYTAAEILDPKFERYLRFSNCDEIILTNEYSRALIANASAGSGISHVISELLNVNSDASINTREIPLDYIGKQYNDLFNYFLTKDHSILIGILENTGNFHTRKKEAIREAQKTPDISLLVDNLKVVKNLMANRPIINPYPDYIVQKYSKAIIIEGRDISKKHLTKETNYGII